MDFRIVANISLNNIFIFILLLKLDWEKISLLVIYRNMVFKRYLIFLNVLISLEFKRIGLMWYCFIIKIKIRKNMVIIYCLKELWKMVGCMVEIWFSWYVTLDKNINIQLKWEIINVLKSNQIIWFWSLLVSVQPKFGISITLDFQKLQLPKISQNKKRW